jgi:rubrerythrin
MVQDREAASLFRELVSAEEQHKDTLVAVFEGLTGRLAGGDFPAGILPEMPSQQYMEGGVRIEEALAWIQGRQVRDMLELAVAVETNAYDRYLILRRDLEDENARRVFEILSDEEHRHLKKLTRLLDHFV